MRIRTRSAPDQPPAYATDKEVIRTAMRRVVFLVDMNAFFISCEMLRRPALRGVPAAVAGDPKTRTGIILAANYEARAFGVKTAMVLHKALALCPGLITVPPDHGFYEKKSSEVMELLARFTPVVEQNSIDEAWLDMTGCEALFGPPADSAARIMADIRDSIGLWCSIGIAENKFLAKMASEMKKPLGITELWPEDIPTKLWPLPVRSIYGVGGRTADRLTRIGIMTIGDLARLDRPFLTRLFGKGGESLHDHANGIDDTPVCAHVLDGMKQIGRSTTLPEDVSDLGKARRILLELVDDIGRTVRRHGKKGRTVHITLKYADFTVATRQARIPETSTTQGIFEGAWQLLAQNWDPGRPVRLIGAALSGFDEASELPPGAEGSGSQISLFDAAPAGPSGPAPSGSDPLGESGKREKLDAAMDRIRARMGDGAVGVASLLKEKRPPRSSPDLDKREDRDETVS